MLVNLILILTYHDCILFYLHSLFFSFRLPYSKWGIDLSIPVCPVVKGRAGSNLGCVGGGVAAREGTSETRVAVATVT